MALRFNDLLNPYIKRWKDDEENRKTTTPLRELPNTPDPRVRGLINPSSSSSSSTSSYSFTPSNLKSSQMVKQSTSDSGIFSPTAFAKYSENNKETPDWLKPIGFALESPFRIPAVNRLFSSAAKVAGGENAIADNAPINTYSTDTRNSFLNKSADVLGGLAGFGLSPRVMGYNGGDANIFKAGNNVAEGASTKLGTFIKTPLLNKATTTLSKGAIDGGLGNLAYDIGQNRDINELPKSALIGAAGGAALFGLGGLASGGSKLSKMATSKIDDAISNLENIGRKTNYTPQEEVLLSKGINTLDNTETPVIKAPKANINTNILKTEDVFPKNNRLLLNAGKEEIPQVNINDYKAPKMTAKQTQSVTKFDELNNKKGVKWYQDNEGDIYGVYKTNEGYSGSIIDKKGTLSKFNSKSSPADYGFKEVNLGSGHSKEEVLSSLDNIISTLEKHANDEKINTPKFNSPFIENMNKTVSKASENNVNTSSILQKNFPIGSKVSFKANMGRGKGDVIGYKTDKWGNEWVEIDTGVKSQTGIGTIKDFKRVDDDIRLENKSMAQNIDNNVTAQKNISMPQNESTITNNDEIAASLGNQVKESKFKTNTWENSPFMADEATQKMVKDIDATYDVQTNEENLRVATYRLNKDFNGTMDRIAKEGIQSAEDSVASGLITNRLIQEAKTTGDYTKVSSWLKVVRPKVTDLAQSLQALSTWKKLTPEGTLLKAQRIIDTAVEKFKTENPKVFKAVEDLNTRIENIIKEINDRVSSQIGDEVMNNLDDILTKGRKDFIDEMAMDIEGESASKTISLKDLIKEHYSNNSASKEDLINKIEKNGYSKEDAKILANHIEKRMQEETKKYRMEELAKALKGNTEIKKADPKEIVKISESNDINKISNFINKRYGIPQLTNDDIKFITDQMNKVEQMKDGRAKDIEFAKVKQLMADKIVPTFSDKIKAAQRISLLLNTKTMTRNVLGNVVMGGLENAKDIPGATIDKIISKTTGKRTTLMPSVEGLKTQVKGGIKGTKEAIEDFKLGVNTNPSSGQYELPSSQAFKGGVMGKLEKVTNAGLTLGDRPFWQGAYDDALRQQLKINKVKEPTEEMINTAQEIANERTFQNTNALVKGFKDIQKALNLGKDFGLGNFVIPFTKTPANILDKAIDYSPIGGIKGVTNLVNGLKKGTLNQKQVVDQLGRGITGSTLMAIGYAMAKGGVLTGQANKDKDVATLEKQAGKSPYAVKTGDTYRTIDWMQPAAIPLMIGADIFHQGKNEKELKNVIANAVVSGGNTLFNQSLLQGIQKFFNTSNSSSGGIMENIGNTITQAPTQFVPSALKEINQLIDNKQRDTSGGVMDQIKAKIPGLAQTLPVKYDTMGREMKTYKNGNNPWNVGFNPGFTTTYSPSEGEKAALNIFEENGNKTQFPQVMDNKISYTDSKTKKKAVVNLTSKEKQELQKNVGRRVNDKFSMIKGGSVEDRIKDMEKILRDIKKEEEDKILRSKGLSRK